jgi:hypothetical protein
MGGCIVVDGSETVEMAYYLPQDFEANKLWKDFNRGRRY